MKVSSLFTLDQDQHYYISVELDSYSMINLVSISFIKFLDISLCMRKKHQHVVSDLENVSEISSTIYEIYYL